MRTKVQGITEMKQAIAAGYPDKVAAYKLLDNARCQELTRSGDERRRGS